MVRFLSIFFYVKEGDHILKIVNLDISYHDKDVLKNINLKFDTGKIYGIIGPNGSGKTSLLNVITNDIKPKNGSVWIDGQRNDHLSPLKMAKKIAYMRQNMVAKFPYTVEELVSMGRYNHCKGKLKMKDQVVVDTIINNTDLHLYKNKAITELSGGELQRVIFAKVLAQNSHIILIDEGLSNADIFYKINFFKLLKKEVSKGKTVIIVLHDLFLARKFCDELVILNNLKVYSQGKSEEVLNRSSLSQVFNITGDFINDSLILY